MTISRRSALVWLAGGVAGAGLGSAVLRRTIAWRPDWWRRLRWDGSSFPWLPDTPPGPLSADAWSTLLALPTALVDHEVELEHYRVFFKFRAESLRGYRWLYEALTADLASKAPPAGVPAFWDLPPSARRTALGKLGLPRSEPSPADWPRMGLQLVRYHRFVIREVLAFFNRTDAWILAGYGAWPGTPRTLAYYQQPIPSQKQGRK